jgi:hypothetical protein
MKISKILENACEVKFVLNGRVYYIFVYQDGSKLIRRYTDNYFEDVKDFDFNTIDEGYLLIAEYRTENYNILNYDLERIEDFCKDKSKYIRRAVRGYLGFESPLDYNFDRERNGVKKYSCPVDELYFEDISLYSKEEQEKIKSSYKYPFKDFIIKTTCSNHYSLD